MKVIDIIKELIKLQNYFMSLKNNFISKKEILKKTKVILFYTDQYSQCDCESWELPRVVKIKTRAFKIKYL